MTAGDQGTLVSLQDGSSAGTFVNHSTGTGNISDGTMINYRWLMIIKHYLNNLYLFSTGGGGGTMLQHNTGPGTALSRTMSEIESNLGTMVGSNKIDWLMKILIRSSMRVSTTPWSSTALRRVRIIILQTSSSILTRRMEVRQSS